MNWPLSSPVCEEDLEPLGCLFPPNRCLLRSCWRATLPFSAPTPWGSATSSRTSSWPSWCVRPRPGAPRGWDCGGTHAMGPPGSSPGAGMGWGLHGLKRGQCPHHGDSDRRSPGRREGRRSCQMSCKGWESWQEQQNLCSRVKAARDRENQELWGPFIQILPFISLSSPPPPREKGSQCLLPARWSKTAPGEPFPAFFTPGSPPCSVEWRGPRCQGPQRAWLSATLCTGSSDKIRSLPSSEYRLWCARDGVKAGAGSVAACQPRERVEIGRAGKSWKWDGGGCAQELLLAGKSFFFFPQRAWPASDTVTPFSSYSSRPP